MGFHLFPLFDGETLDMANAAPALIKFIPGNLKKSLIVFIPGGGHTARIAYGGHPGGQQEDFLAV